MYRGKAYKYRNFGLFDSEVQSRIEQILIERKCYFAPPSTLNDPFDCKPSIQVLAGDLRAYIKNLGKKQGLNLTNKKLTKAVIDIRNEYEGNKYQQLLDNSISVYCLSEEPTLSTQWAYYGGDHTGYCIEYDINEKFAYPAVQVNYSANRPEIDLIKFQKEKDYRLRKMRELATTKSKSWDHEKEIRVLQSKCGLYSVGKSNITGVIFGLRTEQVHKNYIRSIIEANKLNIQCHQCIENSFNYSIFIE